MDLILSEKNGKDIKLLSYSQCDFDLGDNNDFEIEIPVDLWQPEIKFGCLCYEPNSECGGIISAIETDTYEKLIKLKGYTWRGYLDKKIIEPPVGADYRYINGDANSCIGEIINSLYDGLIVASNTNAGVYINNYKFNRYVTVLDGLSAMLASVNHKLKISFNQSGQVEVSAVPIIDYSQDIELSQDYKLNFTIEINKGSVNHLICLGAGQLNDREIINLYVDQNGNIGKAQYYTGLDEIAQTYENANSEDLESDGISKFKELLGKTSLSIDVESLGIDVEIGDIIGGRDYITGMSVAKSLKSKIVTFKDGIKSVEYKLEE